MKTTKLPSQGGFPGGPKTRTVAKTLVILGLAALASGISGCASVNETGSKGKEALVCPQCKMVAYTANIPATRGGYGSGYSGFQQTYYSHTCPGCQGVLETFFREGKWQHKCSICKTAPFTCPVSHPIAQ